MDRANIVIIGGGVIGCALAAELAAGHEDVFLLEALPKLGMAASSRNSGVIHSGLYYPPGSLKAKLCAEGNRLTYEFCAAHEVPHRRTGKLVVAAHAAEVRELEALVTRGAANGVEGLRIVDRAAIRAREPHIEGHAAIGVPSTGIVASEELLKAYARVAADRGANIVLHARVTRLTPQREAVVVTSEAGEIEARCVINSAGLFADEVAAYLGPQSARYRIYPVRGEYCELIRTKAHLVNGLVYPLPHPTGLSLGVHFTKTLWGTALIGPTARYIEDKNNYERDREPVAEFARRAKLLLPEIAVGDLVPAYSGIRAKLTGPNDSGYSDFVIERDAQWPNVIHLVGMDSPGLTSALAIARHVAPLVKDTLR